MALYYVDRDSGSNSNGGTSWGDAWATVAYAVSNAGDTEADTIYVRATTSTVESSTSTISFSGRTNALTLVAADGYGPNDSDGSWRLTIRCTARYSTTVVLGSSAAHVIDGFSIEHTHGSSSVEAITAGSGTTIQNCRIKNAANTAVGSLNGSLINCLIIDSSTGIANANFFGGTIRQCVFADNTTQISKAFSGGSQMTFTGTAFIGHTTLGSGTGWSSSGTSFDYCATSDGSSPGWGTNWVLSLSSTAGVDFEGPAGEDYRAEGSGKLDEGDQSGSAPAEDAYGTSRPVGTYDDIGFYEIPAAGAPDTSLPTPTRFPLALLVR